MDRKFLTTILVLATFVFQGTSQAQDVSRARELYIQHCARCHADAGTGDGPAHTMQRPWPRDFTTGQYKFRSTPLETLPLVEDVEQVIAKGNLRTSMPPFEKFLSQEEIRLLAEYVLEMSREASDVPDGSSQAFKKVLTLDEKTSSPKALELGKKLFQENCNTCHGVDGRGLGSVTGFLYDENNFWIKVPDLTEPLEYGGGNQASDILMRLKTGIPGSTMPVYEGLLQEEELQSIASYVKSLQVPSEDRELISQEAWREALPAKARGEYMVRAMSCSLCHNAYDKSGSYYPDLYLAGGVAITLPGLGVFYTQNLTSHPEDGLHDWTEEEIVKTVMTGYAPDRRLEAFSMPWVFFSHLEPEDAHDIAVYLKSLKPIQNKVPKRKYYPFWKRLYTRIRQLFGLEYGRLEYPPLNQGIRYEEVNWGGNS